MNRAASLVLSAGLSSMLFSGAYTTGSSKEIPAPNRKAPADVSCIGLFANADEQLALAAAPLDDRNKNLGDSPDVHA